MKLGYIFSSTPMSDKVAARLISAMGDTVFWSVDPTALAALRSAGAHVAPSAVELARQSDVVMVSLLKDADVQDLLCSAAGISEFLGPEKIVVNISSGTAQGARELARRLAERGVSVLEARVLVSAAQQAPADLTLVVSGRLDAYEKALSVFEAITPNVIHCGLRPDDAQVVRSIDRAMAAASGLSSLEAVTAGRKMGLSLRSMTEVFVKGSGRNYTTKHVLPALLDGKQSALGASVAEIAADLGEVVSLGIACGIPTPITSVARGLLQAASVRLGPDASFQDVGEIVASMADTKLKDDAAIAVQPLDANVSDEGSKVTIGYVGLGAMGAPLARRLMLSYKVHVHDVRQDAARELVAEGAVNEISLASLARTCDVVVLCVPSSAIVRDVLFGKGGLAEGLSPGKIVIDQTTGDPDEAVVIAAELQKLGVALVDAPVSGGPETPPAGTAVMICGGPEDAFSRVLPILKAIGPTVIYCGPVGSGHAAKLVNNASNICNRLIAYEAAMIGVKYGLTLDALHHCVNKSIGWSFAAERMFKAVGSHAKTASISLELSLKDIASAVKMGIECGAPMLIGDTARNIFATGVHRFGGNANVDEMALLYEQMASIDFTSKVQGAPG